MSVLSFRGAGISRRLFLGAILAFVLAGTAQASFFSHEEYRVLWVDVFHSGIRTPQEIDQLVETARAANYNALAVQMRKACDAYYNSGVEPKNGAIAPQFDPLAYLLQRAHDTSGGKQRLEVFAWLVTYRTRLPGDNLWKSPQHIFQRHPEWMSQKYNGAKEDGGENPGRYYLDPGVPQVIDYTLYVVRDLLARYADLDGITFDYLRYPEGSGRGNQWGYNPIAVARFNALYGRTGKPAPDDPQWNEFRRNQVSHLVRKVYAHVRAWRPQLKVSGAMITWSSVNKGFDKTDAYAGILQDWVGMTRDGFMDVLLPMNYKRESVASQADAHRQWAQFLGQVCQQYGRFGVNVVDGEDLNSLGDIVRQLTVTRSLPGLAGVSTYCYAQTRRESRQVPDTTFFSTIRQQVFPSSARPPEATWLTRPTEGLVKGIVSRNGHGIDGATVQIDGNLTITDGTGFYAFARLKPGNHQVSVLQGTRVVATQNVSVKAGQVAEAPLTLH